MLRKGYDHFSLTIPNELNDWLYNLSREIKRAGGYSVPKTLIVRAFIRAFKNSGKKLNIDNIRVKTKGMQNLRIASSQEVEDELVKRLIRAFK